MEAVVLGVAWLLIAPCCLLVLYRARPIMRVTSVLALVALEVATVGLNHSMRHIDLHPAAEPAVTSARPGDCPSRQPTPERVRQGPRRLTLSWTAGPAQCRVATVSWRRQGHRLAFWVAEGAVSPPGAGGLAGAEGLGTDGRTLNGGSRVDGKGRADAKGRLGGEGLGSRTLPVSVGGRGTASVTLPLALPRGHRALDGRTGRPIPQR